MQEFITETVLKRDIFSETHKGHFAGEPDVKIVRRVVSAAPFWSRPLAWLLANREIRALRAVKGIVGVPQLISTDADGLIRTWTEGAPLQHSWPKDSGWYRDAHRILRAMRRRSITHNDLAKPQNWIRSPDGRAAVIDFQLASRHWRRGVWFRVMAYEDFRHLLKQQQAFAPHLLTPTGKRLLARRSLPSRIWRATGKRLYNFVTRVLFNWSDGEGTLDRVDREGPELIRSLKQQPGVTDASITAYPLPGKKVGIYAFVETNAEARADMLQNLSRGVPGRPILVQAVAQLPRSADGAPRMDLLHLIATNRIDELDDLAGDPATARIAHDIAAGRLNMSDRRLSGAQPSKG